MTAVPTNVEATGNPNYNRASDYSNNEIISG